MSRLTSACRILATVLAVGGGLAAAPAAVASPPVPYEVWLTDQNNTAGFTAEAPRGTHGGRLVIHGSEALDARRGAVNDPTIIDLATIFAVGGPNNATGANVVRPHMLSPSPDHRLIALSFVASGHVAIFDARTHAPKALFRMSAGAGGARQAHAAFWTPDGRALVVANQNGKLLERIEYDPAAGTFVHNTGATLNLATCITPNGYPCETATPLSDSDPNWAGAHNRPDNAPICPVLNRDGKAFVTLRGGGLFVVDITRTPMRIVGEYGTATIGRDGCGGRQIGKRLLLNSGAGTQITNPTEFRLYQLPNTFPAAPGFTSPNQPGASVYYEDATPGTPSDAHAMAVTPGARYLWQFDRLANEAQIFDLKANPPARLGQVDLTARGASDDPTPDIADLSPRGDRFYVALRGPLPQTGAHASQGSTPGLGIVSLKGRGRSGALTQVLRTQNVSPAGAEESDPHGVAVVTGSPKAAAAFTDLGGGTLPLVCDLPR